MKNEKQKRMLVRLFCFAMVSALSLGITACNKDKNKDNSSTPDSSTDVGTEEYGEEGVYYYDAENGEDVMTLSDSAFVLTLGDTAVRGLYTYDGTAMSLVFEGAEAPVSATLQNGVLAFEYNGKAYSFYKKVNYTVTYEVNGGSAVAAATVVNGKAAVKPADPTKAGYNFIGWYKDAEFTQPYVFETAVTSNVTLYARFVAAVVGQSEYTVTLNVDGKTDAYAQVKTIGGVAYDLPTPTKADATFQGWWTSDKESATELTEQYVGQTLTENKTLYAVWASDAPSVSVNAKEITWTGMGLNKSYSVKVTGPDGAPTSESTGETKLAYNFAAKAAGEYTVEVTVDGKTGKAVYVNKALDTVSHISVTEPSVLVWSAVPNAEKYIVEFECGEANHDHKKFDNGTSTYFNFANCPVPKDGLKFKVTAVAAGYVSSTSAEYVYTRNLAAVTNLTVDAENDRVVWNAVDGATSYEVEVTVGTTKYTVNVNTTSYSLKNETGKIAVQVTAKAEGYNATASEVVTYDKTKLAAPTDIKLNGTTLTWTATPNAKSYVVSIAGKTYTTETASYSLAGTPYVDGNNVYEVSVQAVAEDATKNSSFSDPVEVNYQTVGALAYANGKVTWDYVVGATKYGLTINDQKEIEVGVMNNFYEITLPKAGKNVIKVRHFDKDGIPTLAHQEIEIMAYEVRFDVDGAETGVRTLYKAIGDPVDFPEAVREGYEFQGWYNVRGGAPNNGKKWTSAMYDYAGPLTLYAYWRANEYTANLDLDDGEADLDVTTVSGRYGEAYELPTLESKVEGKFFDGWYTKPNGKGIKLSGADGVPLTTWNITGDTIYANWIEPLSFSLINGDKEYAVKQGVDISKVEVVEIPATYKGKEVTKIAANAFGNCSKLTKIRIPDTVTDISLGEFGTTASGGAFYACARLAEIEVYCGHADGHDDTVPSVYESHEGMLIQNNTFENYKDLVFVPQAHEQLKVGTMKIPAGVERIPANMFKNSNFKKLIVSHTVKVIESQALMLNSTLSEIEFLPTPEGETPVPFTLASEVFRACYNLSEITLPSRLESLVTETNLASFKNCTKLTKLHIDNLGEGNKFTSHDGLLLSDNGTKLVYCPVNRDGKVTIPDTVRVIGENVFEWGYGVQAQRDLSSIEIPGSVQKIEANAFKDSPIRTVTFLGTKDEAEQGYVLDICANAFSGCTKLTEVVLPANLNKLEANAFGGCTNLTEVTLDCAKNAVLEADAFADEDGNFYVTDLTIGADAPYFDIAAVFGSTKLTNLSLDEANNTSFSKDTYGIIYDYGKTKVAFYPSGITVTDYEAPETLTQIAADVFKGKTSITSVTLGANLTSIGANAFKGCTNLATLTFTGTRTAEQTLTIGNNAFEDTILSMEAGLTLPVGVTTIGEAAFKNTQIKQISLPEGLTSIGASAFVNADFTAVTLPTTLTELGAGAFAFTGLTAVSLPEGLAIVGENAFNGTPVATLHISSTITDYGTLTGLDSLTTITVAENNASYSANQGVLYNKAGTAILFCPANSGGDENGVLTIANTIAQINANAFAGNKKVKEIKFADGGDFANLVIETNAFSGSAIEKVTLPTGFTTIEKALFKGCTSLKEVFIPKTVTTIKAEAFVGCSSLAKVTFEEWDTYTDTALVFDGLVEEKMGTGFRPTLVKVYGPIFSGTAIETFNIPVRTTELSTQMFLGETSLKTVSIPAGIKTLPSQIFSGCTNLTNVNFAEGSQLETVAAAAFYNNVSLASTFKLPDTVTSIAGKAAGIGGTAGAFTGTIFTKFYVPAGITDLGTIFAGMTTLTELEYAENCAVTTIPAGAFAGCTGLTSFEIPASVTTLGKSSNTPTSTGCGIFEDCTNLTEITFAPGSKLTNVYSGAFGRDADGKTTAPAITSIEIPVSSNNITLAAGIFAGSTTMKTVTLSKSVNSMSNIFQYCDTITSVTINSENTKYKVNGAAIVALNEDGTSKNVLCHFKTSDATTVDLTGMTSIPAEAFKNQTKLQTITIPAAVTSIGANAFEGCTSLSEVIFEPRTTAITIGNYAFANCSALTQIELPKLSATATPTFLFRGCTDLTKVIIPEGIETFGNSTFRDCSSLKTIQVRDGEILMGQPGELTFPKSLTSLTSTYVFAGTAIEKVVIPAGITSLGKNHKSDSYLFRDCPSLASVDLNEVTDIGRGAFRGCTALESIDLSKVLRIGGTNASGFGYTAAMGAFAGSGLKSVTLSSSYEVTAMTDGRYMFAYCTQLEEVVLPDGITLIPHSMFRGCTALETINLPITVTDVQWHAFRDTALKAIDLSNVTTIKEGAFSGCTKLTTVGSLNSTLTYLDRFIFQKTESLKSINFPAGLTEIKECAFDGSGLTEVNLSTTAVERIGAYAFRGTSITSIDVSMVKQGSYYDGSVYVNGNELISYSRGSSNKEVYFDGLADGIFENCVNLTTVTVSTDLRAINRRAFAGCTSLKTMLLKDVEGNIIGANGIITIPAEAAVFAKSLFEIDEEEYMASKTKVSVTDSSAFAGSGIESVEFLGQVTKFDPSVFEGCASLSSVVFTKGAAAAAFNNAKAAFKGCVALKELVIPSTVTTIAADMFNGAGLESVTIAESVATIGANAFANCANLKSFAVDALNENFKVGSDGNLYTVEDELVAELPTV